MTSLSRALNDQEKAELFRYFRSFSAIPDAELERFASCVLVHEFNKGQTFDKVGDKKGIVGYVFSGGFQVAYISESGDLKIRNFCQTGSLIGSYATIIANQPVHVEIKAFELSRAAVVDFAVMQESFSRHASWERLGRRIAQQHYLRREEREYQFLTKTAEERYKLFTREFPGLSERITQTSIASYIGVTPVALSRILNRK
jgi:CRP-like cAMP-binding protein